MTEREELIARTKTHAFRLREYANWSGPVAPWQPGTWNDIADDLDALTAALDSPANGGREELIAEARALVASGPGFTAPAGKLAAWMCDAEAMITRLIAALYSPAQPQIAESARFALTRIFELLSEPSGPDEAACALALAKAAIADIDDLKALLPAPVARNEVIEECARVADQRAADYRESQADPDNGRLNSVMEHCIGEAEEIAAAIRALKDKQP